MRSIWNGTIAFGLVSISIKLYLAVQESSLDLDMLDSRGHSNIHFMRMNAQMKEEVPYGKIVKGYKLNDEYVILDEHDFKKASSWL